MKQFKASWNVAVGSSAAFSCYPSWLTDFRDDLPHIDVPTLIIHGDADPFCRLSPPQRLIKTVNFVIPGGPHANWTHAIRLIPFVDFLQGDYLSSPYR